MAPKLPFDQLIDKRYGDRGGYKGLVHIYQTPHTNYEFKLESISEQYKVSRGQAARWYSTIKGILGVANDVRA